MAIGRAKVAPFLVLMVLVYQLGFFRRVKEEDFALIAERRTSVEHGIAKSEAVLNKQDEGTKHQERVGTDSEPRGQTFEQSEETHQPRIGARQQERPPESEHHTLEADDIHRSSVGILGLQEWELKTLEKPFTESCNTPEGVHQVCCLGTSAHDLVGTTKKKFREDRAQCDHVTLEDYNWQKQQAKEELAKSGKEDHCDACTIVDRLQEHKLKFAFFGDSVSSQSTNAFICELQRRNYSVTLEFPSPGKAGDGFRNFREIRRLHIESPTWKGDSITNSTLVLDFIFQYRLPFLFPEQQEAITSNYDVLIVNFGQHWIYQPDPNDTWERERYNRNTFPGQIKYFFDSIRAANKVKLLAWRENTASHFDGDGGDYSLARLNPGFKTGNSTCVPYRSSDRALHAWKETAFLEGIQQTDYDLVTVGKHMPPVTGDRSELVIIPFYEFSSKSHLFHARKEKAPDCLHYCYSPFFYLPIWRGIRLAMDRSFGVE